jgi:hypothetical protein
MSTAAQRRQEVLQRAWDRRRRLAAEREQQPLRTAMFVGGAVGLVVGVVLGQAFWVMDLAGPSIAAVVGVALGAATGAAVILARAHAVARAHAREVARAREEERARRREEARRERRERGVVSREPLPATHARTRTDAPASGGRGDEFLVPPGFYPDPDDDERRRWWDGVKWTAKRVA